jgi:hypothetical protein
MACPAPAVVRRGPGIIMSGKLGHDGEGSEEGLTASPMSATRSVTSDRSGRTVWVAHFITLSTQCIPVNIHHERCLRGARANKFLHLWLPACPSARDFLAPDVRNPRPFVGGPLEVVPANKGSNVEGRVGYAILPQILQWTSIVNSHRYGVEKEGRRMVRSIFGSSTKEGPRTAWKGGLPRRAMTISWHSPLAFTLASSHDKPRLMPFRLACELITTLVAKVPVPGVPGACLVSRLCYS